MAQIQVEEKKVHEGRAHNARRLALWGAGAVVVATRLANGGASGREREGACERRMAKEGKKKGLYNASKVRSFHAAAGADSSIV